ncbi:MAG TPA: low affinity iron permease family protein [Thermomicrobiales bacterium]|nr:low affinity iron permease family protein [Thermomicrobiales bacterium]
MSDRFAAMAKRASTLAGSYRTFIVAIGLVLVWAASGPFFGFSQTWQLVINTSTTIVTFLMVFLIQNTQNRDSEALHLKIDELINAISEADDSMMEAEDDTDRELKALKAKYQQLAKTKGVASNET